MTSAPDIPIAVRPTMRGVLHRYAAICFAIAFLVLIAITEDGAGRVWVGVYGACVTTMLSVSAIYHSGKLASRGQRLFKRIDHSTILLAIAGSYTGIAGLSLDGRTRVVVLTVVWVAALGGIAIRMLWLHAPYPVVAAVYIVVGWVVLLDLGAFIDGLTSGQLALLVLGGVLYSLGAVVYALHRPNPWPATFGYHEVFHGIVVLAAASHFAVVASLVAAR